MTAAAAAAVATPAPAVTTESEGRFASHIAHNMLGQGESLETLVAGEHWIAIRLASLIVTAPGAENVLARGGGISILYRQSSQATTATSVDPRKVSVPDMLDMLIASPPLKGRPNNSSSNNNNDDDDDAVQRPQRWILEHLAVFISHAASLVQLPPALAHECFNVLAALQTEPAVHIDHDRLQRRIQVAMHGYLRHAIDAGQSGQTANSSPTSAAEFSRLVLKTVKAIGNVPCDVDCQSDADRREAIEFACGILGTDSATATRPSLTVGATSPMSAKVRLAKEHLTSSRMADSEVRVSGKWFRQAGALKDRQLLLDNGLEAVRANGQTALTGELLANYIKSRIKRLPMGLVPDPVRDLMTELLGAACRIWVKPSALAAVKRLLSINPQRREILGDVVSLLTFIMSSSTDQPITLDALASHDSLVAMGSMLNAPAQPVDTARASMDSVGAASNKMAPSAPANDIKQKQMRWHRVWGLLYS
ncbi:hypothetical protein BC831DRAFT_444668 [Entophlyctis helioformis]|nr:hypothetical protein BC831DRAFT_444668 [Entophlyctis helioformis]